LAYARADTRQPHRKEQFLWQICCWVEQFWTHRLGLFVNPELVCDGTIVVPLAVLWHGPLHEKNCEVHPATQVAVVFAVALGAAFGTTVIALFGALLCVGRLGVACASKIC
jgi:hypothetical protein